MKIVRNSVFPILLMAVVSACSVSDLQDGNRQPGQAKRIDLVYTGDPAVDASLAFLTEAELRAFGHIADSDNDLAVKSSGDGSIVSYVYGPLRDRRIVRGKRLVVSVMEYPMPFSSNQYVIRYGFYGGTDLVTNTVENGYGMRLAMLDVPSDATEFRYFVEDQNGNVFDNNGVPFSVKPKDSAVSLKIIENYDGYRQLIINYAGSVADSGTSIHYGWNDWNNVGETYMMYYSYPNLKYASPGGYVWTSIPIPNQANYSDFVFRNGSSWDNNNGNDWHYSLNPLVDYRIDNNSSNGSKNVTVFYANGSLGNVWAHYGINGWNNVGDKFMNYVYSAGSFDEWTVTLNLPESANTLNLAFADFTTRIWENNYGMNWNFDIE
jgi:hypothetical protein